MTKTKASKIILAEHNPKANPPQVAEVAEVAEFDLGEHSGLAMELFGLFKSLGKAIHGNYSQELRAGQFVLLQKIISLGDDPLQGIKASAISKAMALTQPTITPMINKLEEEGYVQRKPHPTDRRVVLVALTPKGLAIYEQCILAQQKRMAGLVDYLSREDLAKLLELLGKTVDYLQDYQIKERDTNAKSI